MTDTYRRGLGRSCDMANKGGGRVALHWARGYLKDNGQELSSAQPPLDLDATSLGIKW